MRFALFLLFLLIPNAATAAGFRCSAGLSIKDAPACKYYYDATVLNGSVLSAGHPSNSEGLPLLEDEFVAVRDTEREIGGRGRKILIPLEQVLGFDRSTYTTLIYHFLATYARAQCGGDVASGVARLVANGKDCLGFIADGSQSIAAGVYGEVIVKFRFSERGWVADLHGKKTDVHFVASNTGSLEVRRGGRVIQSAKYYVKDKRYIDFALSAIFWVDNEMHDDLGEKIHE